MIFLQKKSEKNYEVVDKMLAQFYKSDLPGFMRKTFQPLIDAGMFTEACALQIIDEYCEKHGEDHQHVRLEIVAVDDLMQLIEENDDE